MWNEDVCWLQRSSSLRGGRRCGGAMMSTGSTDRAWMRGGLLWKAGARRKKESRCLSRCGREGDTRKNDGSVGDTRSRARFVTAVCRKKIASQRESQQVEQGVGAVNLAAGLNSDLLINSVLARVACRWPVGHHRIQGESAPVLHLDGRGCLLPRSHHTCLLFLLSIAHGNSMVIQRTAVKE